MSELETEKQTTRSEMLKPDENIDNQLDHLPAPLRRAIERYARHHSREKAMQRVSQVAQESAALMVEPDGDDQLRARVVEESLVIRCLEWVLDDLAAPRRRSRPKLPPGEPEEAGGEEGVEKQLEDAHELLDEAEVETASGADLSERVRGVLDELQAEKEMHEEFREMHDDAAEVIGEIREALGLETGEDIVASAEQLADTLGTHEADDRNVIERAKFFLGRLERMTETVNRKNERIRELEAAIGASDRNPDETDDQEEGAVDGDWKMAGELGDEIGESAQKVSLEARKRERGDATDFAVERRKAKPHEDTNAAEFVYRLTDDDPEPDDESAADEPTYLVGDEVPGGVVPEHEARSRETALRYGEREYNPPETCKPVVLEVDGDVPELGERLKWDKVDVREDIQVVQ